jgi:hypothetical protein
MELVYGTVRRVSDGVAEGPLGVGGPVGGFSVDLEGVVLVASTEKTATMTLSVADRASSDFFDRTKQYTVTITENA